MSKCSNLHPSLDGLVGETIDGQLDSLDLETSEAELHAGHLPLGTLLDLTRKILHVVFEDVDEFRFLDVQLSDVQVGASMTAELLVQSENDGLSRRRPRVVGWVRSILIASLDSLEDDIWCAGNVEWSLLGERMSGLVRVSRTSHC